MNAVNAGVIYHYYWYGDRADDGADSKNTELVYFGGQDPGAGPSTPYVIMLSVTFQGAPAST
ncbi:hypothetical protein Psuf_069160 [Phytohabitans suffuscus]|uniref:Uncharacterized protein n=1 Tax=Phytohabitans suffuscus TaxID=624315 RepID=A0A6F8YUE9_9ACTN|nr:hypothetical protein [Phytohabitans suffuscus]BCB89603.1 hypothetical protein Psuf_069160 [Phytohabitans suffuscus]